MSRIPASRLERGAACVHGLEDPGSRGPGFRRGPTRRPRHVLATPAHRCLGTAFRCLGGVPGYTLQLFFFLYYFFSFFHLLWAPVSFSLLSFPWFFLLLVSAHSLFPPFPLVVRAPCAFLIPPLASISFSALFLLSSHRCPFSPSSCSSLGSSAAGIYVHPRN